MFYCLNTDDVPMAATEYSSGLDLCASESVDIPAGHTVKIKTNTYIDVEALDIVEQHTLDIQVRPRSSVSLNGLLVHHGTIDSDYTGEICVIITNLSGESRAIAVGQRIAQIVVGKRLWYSENQIRNVKRTGGFGSTDV